MRTWFFTEDAYPNLPDAETYESIRVNLPNKHFDPDTGADLYHPTFPIWLNIPLSKSSAFLKPLSICETLAVGMAIITP